ncbi:interleukin-18 isoform X2 [Mustela erminea]|uniref:interleukin-18 isoform X2 n=1 Tax=Mustela erminea TaxID=36723 RepID=UPI001386923B|nr:interleukin-18 isoform X2 [Mustela erminea]
MATNPAEDNCINFVGMKFIDNTLYFVAENDDNLESDYFGKLEPRLSIIRNLNDQVLFVNEGNQPVFEDMPDSDCAENASHTVFIINMYKDSLTRGLAVTISVMCNKMSTLSCKNKTISFKVRLTCLSHVCVQNLKTPIPFGSLVHPVPLNQLSFFWILFLFSVELLVGWKVKAKG